jgi:hypothetical protein
MNQEYLLKKIIRIKAKVICAIIFIAFISQSCVQNKSLEIITSKFKSDKIMLVSCIQCKCINEELEKMYNKDNKVFNGYLFFGDTNCLSEYKFKAAITHISQRTIDSLFLENYNLTIINTDKYPNKVISIKTQDATKIKAKL